MFKHVLHSEASFAMTRTGKNFRKTSGNLKTWWPNFLKKATKLDKS